jgi:Xaa-Pro aminopeptidase
MNDKAIPTYSAAERDRRWKLGRDFMNKEGVDALLVFGEHEDSGPATVTFDTWLTNERPGSTIVFPQTGEPISLVPFTPFLIGHLDASRKGDPTWISPCNIRLGRDASAIADVLNELELAKGTVGVVGLEPSIPWHPEGIVPFRLWNTILSWFPDITFKPVAEGFTQLQTVLGEEDITVVRYAASIGDAMALAMVEAARPGVGENAVYIAGMAAAYAQGTIVPSMHLTSSPEAIGLGPPPWSYRPQPARVLQNGDVIIAEIFSNFGMRATQHQLTIAIGKVHEDVERAAAIARACYEAGLGAVRPKARFADVGKVMLAPVEKAGGWVRGPQIHSLNPIAAICATPSNMSQLTGADRYPQVKDEPMILGDMELEVGMSFAFEPSCGFGHHLVCVGGTVIVGEHGPIELNPYTAQLHRVMVE